MDFTLILLVAGAVFLGSLMRATFGFGDSVVSMPLLALLPIPFSSAVALVGLVGFTVALFFAGSAWKHKDPIVLKKLSIATLAGIPFGLLLVRIANQQWISLFLGIILVTYSIYSISGSETRQQNLETTFENTNYSLPFGFASGMLGSAYNMNGIPVVLYATTRDWTPIKFIGNVQSHFIVSSTLIVLGHFLSGFWTKDVGIYYISSLPAIVLAVWIGSNLYHKMDTDKFKHYVFYLILFLGILNLMEIF